jgi:Xaa-Pro aminopeptidase
LFYVIALNLGIYIRPDEQSVPGRYRGIGIRIEDDIAITESGCDVLSKKCPKTIEDLENLMNNKN